MAPVMKFVFGLLTLVIIGMIIGALFQLAFIRKLEDSYVIADPGGGVFISDPKKTVGGHVLAHAATIRLMFKKGKGEQRVCKVFDAPNLPEAEAISFFSLPTHLKIRRH